MKVFAIRTNSRHQTWRVLIKDTDEDNMSYLLKDLLIYDRSDIDTEDRDVFNSSREAIGALKKVFTSCKRVPASKAIPYFNFHALSSDIFFIQE